MKEKSAVVLHKRNVGVKDVARDFSKDEISLGKAQPYLQNEC
jgi:hypothetical protein